MHIIDNVNSRFGDDLRKRLRNGGKMSIAAAAFSMFAYEKLRQELEAVEELRFVFTKPTFVSGSLNTHALKQRREFFIPKAQREQTLYGSDFEIQLRNKLTQRAIARECADWIRRKAKFKSVVSSGHFPLTFNVKSALGPDVSYLNVPSFTTTELGYERGDAHAFSIVPLEGDASLGMLANFNALWQDSARLEDVTEAVCNNIETLYRENSPERIYYLTLHTIFESFLNDITEDVLPKQGIKYRESMVWRKLYNFQEDAATGIINKLETYNGCILADSVGLGKTFTALAVIRYYELRNDRVLVLCPKKLSENWLNYNSNLVTNLFAKDQFNYDVLSHTDLSREGGMSNGIPLAKLNWGAYDLVVIDESHNFRNGGSGFTNNEEGEGGLNRYEQLMERIIRQGVPTKVLMLSATPVNNRFNDLKNQLALAYKGNAALLEEKLHISRGIDDVFRQAQTVFNRWVELPKADRTTQAILNALDRDFFELLDSVTISRSRKHIEIHYDTTDIGTFPKRLKPKSIHSPLTHREDIFDYNDIFARLSELILGVYTPLTYVHASRRQKYEDRYSSDAGEGRMLQSSRESGVKALMTTNLLKRLESSVHAFRITLRKLNEQTKVTLEKIDVFERSGASTQLDWNTDAFASDDEDGDFAVGNRYRFDLADMDLISWRRDLSADHAIINELLESMSQIKPEDDAKLQDLITRVLAKAQDPINDNNRKVLVFTAFADTADYLYEHLGSAAKQRRGLHTGIVTGRNSGSTHDKHYDFQSLLTVFSPGSKDKALVMPNDTNDIDFLVATDCISEGQNLQDCDYLINYDIHWNPVRIVQRFGRVDRIGSPNATIQLVNYWPDISLDAYINLKERVENRMVLVDTTATGDDNVLTNEHSKAAYRNEQLMKLQDEVIELEEANSGIALTDLGLNDFRMDLVSHVRTQGALSGLPKGLHAVLPADPTRGLPEGVVFVLRSLRETDELSQHNRLHPHYLVYVDMAGEIVVDHTNPKHLLDLLRTHCKGISEPVADVCRSFNARTRDGANMEPYSALLTQAISGMVSRKQEKDIDSLFSDAASTALLAGFKELGDFELTTFFVIERRAL